MYGNKFSWINGAAKYRSTMLLQCRKYKSKRIIHRRFGPALRAREICHWPALRIPRVPSVAYIPDAFHLWIHNAVSRKTELDVEVVLRSREKGGFARVRCAILLAVNRVPRHSSPRPWRARRDFVISAIVSSWQILRKLGESGKLGERSSPTAFLREKAERRADR